MVSSDTVLISVTHILLFQKASQLSIDSNLKEYVKSQNNHKVSYAIIRGSVVPIGAPIQSVIAPSVTGVVQTIKLR